MKLRLISAAALLASGSAAMAGGFVAPAPVDPVVVAPVVAAPAFDWTGPYAGIQAGKLVSGSLSFPGAADQDVDGTAYGLHGGYMHDFGQFVLGGELAYNKLNSVKIDNGNGHSGHEVMGKVLAGYDAGRWMPYATIGYGEAKLKDFNGTGTDVSGSGLLYGAGVKFKATENILVGAEVLKRDYKDFGADDVDLDATTVGLNVSYQF
ncbi:MAG: outer membrane beta-barrel protein [Paracoccus sp. (in: a-proteobacteria)]|uniref:outer membrane protein n=1 Tax=Paracoccus sp. TaxID=267 RepID=UPI0026DF2C39|nr:outer membrane beta-barrel protein [Paracoccus sp. (in: a-proteobacteria)]MDO5622044.1 outer membrane beta-barrel protein [Paracoccus sp. (in: a-proteobacteria)]